MGYFIRSNQLLNLASGNYFIRLYFDLFYLIKNFSLVAKIFSFKSRCVKIIIVFFLTNKKFFLNNKSLYF